MRIGAAGHHCGGRWVNDSRAAINAISGKWEVDVEKQGLQGTFAAWINNYKEGVLESLTLLFTPRIGRVFQPHIFNYMAKRLVEYGIELPNADVIDLNDPLIPDLEMSDSDNEKIKHKFDEYFGMMALSKFITDKINEELKLNRGPFTDLVVNTMRDFAETQIQTK